MVGVRFYDLHSLGTETPFNSLTLVFCFQGFRNENSKVFGLQVHILSLLNLRKHWIKRRGRRLRRLTPPFFPLWCLFLYLSLPSLVT